MTNEIKTVVAKLKSVAEEAKRTVFIFENPAGGEYDLKVSAFQPHTLKLKIGNKYTFDVEFVPMKDDPNKFYKNFVRVGDKTSPYKIIEGDAGQIETYCMPEPKPKPTLTTPSAIKQTMQSAPQQTKPTDEYWEARNDSIVRQAVWKAACEAVAGLAMAGKVQSAEQMRIVIIDTAEEGYVWVNKLPPKARPTAPEPKPELKGIQAGIDAAEKALAQKGAKA